MAIREMTRLLLNSGADIAQSSGNRTSPLLIALLNGQVGIATELLDRGADPNCGRCLRPRRPCSLLSDLRNFNH